MVWARFDDNYSDSPKVLEAGPWCELLDMRAIIYACRNETDGRITLIALERIAHGIPAARKKADRLVEVGRWTVAESGGYFIHDFLKYNPSKATLSKRREEGKVRAEASRSVRANQIGNERALAGGRAQDGTGVISAAAKCTNCGGISPCHCPASLDEARQRREA